MNVLDLFSGIGGFSLGLERAGFKTIAFCEIDPFCRRVLRKHWPDVPIFEDVRTLTAKDVGSVDVICGGYPCQPFSVAGKRLGAADDRHLWPEYRRLIEELGPTWVIGENVVGHINLGLDSVLSDLETLGYSWRPFVIPACAVDAKHRRDRVWIVAHSVRGRDRAPKAVNKSALDKKRHAAASGEGWAPVAGPDVAYTNGKRGCLRDSRGQYAGDVGESSRAWKNESEWFAESGMGRVANGVPNRVDRLRSLGNAVVPQIPEIIGRAILKAEGVR